MELTQKKCLPCEGGVEKLKEKEAQGLLKEIPGWELKKDQIFRKLKFKNFLAAMTFINQMADLAEAEGHHPDFTVHYNQVEITIWTHAIGGLSENDFILAAKINALPTIPAKA